MKIIYVNCGKRDKYGSNLRSIENYLSSSEIRPEKKSEYLHKVSDVYNNNYLMQCPKVIYNSNSSTSIVSVVHHIESSVVSGEKSLIF